MEFFTFVFSLWMKKYLNFENVMLKFPSSFTMLHSTYIRLIAQKGLPLSNLCISAELFNNECCFQQKRNILNNKLTKTETEQNEKFVFFVLPP
jgi:hypothetical protein